ncbi:MAG: threonine synthase [Acidobacteriia bacterium]|nr:threonine synthase [Terriglobia bacterium]
MSAYLQCISCPSKFRVDEILYHCTRCGDLLDVKYDGPAPDPRNLKLTFQNRKLSPTPEDQSGVWRFRDLFPFLGSMTYVVSLREGNTPLWNSPRVAKRAGLQQLTVKHLGMNPTGSFKDYGMTTAISQAKALGMQTVLCASTGNTAASMAAYAARAGMKGVVLIPQGQIALGKLAQAIDYGARVAQIDGSFDEAMLLVDELAREGQAYLLNSLNPFRLEGQKAIVMELLEQRGWRPPDRIILPGGNLGNCSAFGKALKELHEMKFINPLPRLTVVQAEGANPFARLVHQKASALQPLQASTLATAIQIGNPVSWKKARRALEWTQGDVIDVSEKEIADARALLAQDGIGCEPASAASAAGLLKLSNERRLKASDDIVLILTGHQLKDPEYIVKYHAGDLSHEGKHIASQFRNVIHSVPAEAGAIRKLIS